MSDTHRAREAFRAHEDEQLRYWAGLTPSQRLEGLEQMKVFCFKYLGAAAKDQTVNLPDPVVRYRRSKT